MREDKAVCRLCSERLSYRTTATNLQTHLIAFPPSEAQQTSKARSSVQPSDLRLFGTQHQADPFYKKLVKNVIADKLARFITFLTIDPMFNFVRRVSAFHDIHSAPRKAKFPLTFRVVVLT